MSGHVFVVQGDLTHLACDDWLLPTDREVTLTEAWLPTLRPDAVGCGDDGVPQLTGGVDDAFRHGTVRVVAVSDDVRAKPAGGSPLTTGRAWLLDVGPGDGVEARWLVDGVREWLSAAAESRRHSDAAAGTFRRARPLVALPLVGTGAGGAAERRDEVLAELLPALEEHADRCGVDVALVLNDVRDHAAAQDVRRALHRDGSGSSWDLDDELVDAADELAALVDERRLSLFIGAGVSRAAGLPVWTEFIDELLDTTDADDAERAAVARLEVPDQAEFVARRLDGGEEALRELVRERFAARPHALAHALLSTLPVRETVTTNWDSLFEQAAADAGRHLAVLPYEDAAGADGWVLKLHGDARRGEGLVVRRSDYLRFGAEQQALAGMVHSLLFTRHMLFVGFSLVDDNFIRIVDDVTRLVDRYAGREHRHGADRRRLGTTLALHDDPAKRTLWPHLAHLLVAPASDDDDTDRAPADRAPADRAPEDRAAEQARRLEIFLDLLSARVGRPPAYLLDERYGGLLDGPDRALAERLQELAADASNLEGAAAWPLVHRLLAELGRSGGPEPGLGTGA